MPAINNTEKLRDWLIGCPHIAASKYFGADYMGSDSTEYAVISVPSTLLYRENILGERVLREKQEQNFIFAAKVPFSKDVLQNLSNLGFFQDVKKWIAAQNKAGNFPEWDDGTITAIECTNTGAPVYTDANEARYQFQLKITYKINDERE